MSNYVNVSYLGGNKEIEQKILGEYCAPVSSAGAVCRRWRSAYAVAVRQQLFKEINWVSARIERLSEENYCDGWAAATRKLVDRCIVLSENGVDDGGGQVAEPCIERFQVLPSLYLVHFCIRYAIGHKDEENSREVYRFPEEFGQCSLLSVNRHFEFAPDSCRALDTPPSSQCEPGCTCDQYCMFANICVPLQDHELRRQVEYLSDKGQKQLATLIEGCISEKPAEKAPKHTVVPSQHVPDVRPQEDDYVLVDGNEARPGSMPHKLKKGKRQQCVIS